jgi:hypothetical protein
MHRCVASLYNQTIIIWRHFLPLEPLGAIVGKCSHGTDDDDSRADPATGGIYKGRVSINHAPHHMWHHQAWEAAAKATHHFLMDDSEHLKDLLLNFMHIIV